MLNAGAAVGRSGLSRVTLAGEQRRVDLVLPSGEPVGRLLPEVLELLGDHLGSRPQLRQLVTVDGTVLAPDDTLESAGIADGAMLRLVRAEDAPAVPVVHDVADEAADDLDERGWRWGPASRRVTCAAAAVAWALVAGMLARREFPVELVAGWLIAAAVAVALIGALCGRAGLKGLATALIVLGGAVGALGGWAAADTYGEPTLVRLVNVTLAVAVTLLLLGSFTPLGRAGVIGGADLAVVLTGWVVALALQSGGETAVQQARAGAMLTVASVVGLGVLPRLALTAAGLGGLDDRRASGASVSRYRVAAALSATHRGLALSTIVIAVSAACAGVLALRDPTVWTVSLTTTATLVLLLRARAFPLIVEVVVLYAAGALLVLWLVLVWLERSGDAVGPLGVLVALAVVQLLVLAVDPPEHVRARLRRLGDLAESVGVIALFPLVIGVFGVYGRLLDTFA